MNEVRLIPELERLERADTLAAIRRGQVRLAPRLELYRFQSLDQK